MHEAKTRLSELVELVLKGQRVVIARSGVPVADIVAHREGAVPRQGGQWRGRARIADDFDAPLPEIDELFCT